MAKVAFVFAGQGGQYSGMGKDLYDSNLAAREVFVALDKVHDETSRLCFFGSKKELTQTVNTQPALFAVDLACAVALADQGIKPQAVAGFSLGEWPAVAFCGMLSYDEAFSLTCQRAQFMQECAEHHPGVMMAVLRLTSEQVEKLCEQFTDVYAVNYNCPGQLVVAGIAEQMEQFALAVKDAGGRALKLAVSGAFHSPLMGEAADKMAQILEHVDFNSPKMSIYSNVTAQAYGDCRKLLTKQIISPVKWQQTIENMIEDGFDTFIEVGAGKTLSGLIKKISKDVNVYNVEDMETLQATVSALQS
ncbi:MAG: ACP S-malonyltransferase [Bacillota bacterium]|jgi:[acyl-carrier-protein] S-malonyltransferase